MSNKPRIGYMIVLNGLKHLKHNNYIEYLLAEALDYLVVVEGAVDGTKGSAHWSGIVSADYHKSGNSKDGTVEYLQELNEKHKNLHVIFANGLWSGKDEMVNTAIDKIKEITNECFLWEIDADEQWTSWKMDEIELELIDNNADCIQVMFHQMMGKRLLAYGDFWGGNTCFRVWDWKGQKYQTHAPPILEGGNGKIINVHHRFLHYSYHFKEDVKFKSDWYYKDENILKNWKVMQDYKKSEFPVDLGFILPRYSNLNSKIYKIPDKNIDFKWTRWSQVKETNKKVLENINLNNIPEYEKNKENNFSMLFNLGRQLFKYRTGQIDIANYDNTDYQVQIIKNGIDNLKMEHHDINILNNRNDKFDIVYINGNLIKSEDIENSIEYRKDCGYIYISNYNENETKIKLLIDKYYENEIFKEFFYIPAHNGSCLII